jgi:two-component system response regulator LytT
MMDPIKILIVEDELLIATNLKLILQDMGYAPLDPVGTKDQAIETLQKEKPDLALLDINLQGKQDGITIGQYINDHVKIPFIFLTSNADKPTILAAKTTLPSAYLIKPFTEDDIYAAIEIALEVFSPDKTIGSDEEKLAVLKDCVFVKQHNRYVKVAISEITYILVQDKYLEINTLDNKKFVVRSSMESILTSFKPHNFIRVHRSYSINPLSLQEINGDVIVVNKVEIPIGRAFRDDLIKKIQTMQ